MERRTVLVVIAGGLLAAPHVVEAQQAANVPRIGYLSYQSSASHLVKVFHEGLRGVGYFEGQNIIVEYRWAHEEHTRLPELAADLVRRNVRLIVAPGNREITAAKAATSTIPIVMIVAVDPVGAGFVASIARPGGNLTGLAWAPAVEIVGKHMELLKEVVPTLSRIAVLVDPSFPGIAPYRDAAEGAATKLGLTYQEIEVRETDDFQKAFAAIVRERSEAVFIQGSPRVFAHLRDLVNLAARHRIPAAFVFREAVPLGGLMSYGVDLVDLYRRAPTFVVKILNGAKPADLPVEQATKFDLVINLRTAKTLGLTLPPSLLQRADQVIE
jgi:ABC-type uncharacterized transport system substrate-binding protein